MAMPVRQPSVVLAPPPCQRLPVQTSTSPRAISAGIDSASTASRYLGVFQWWLPGTRRVAPFASVKSVSAHIVLHTVGKWGLAMRII